jgi:hypothetical protein
MMAHDTDPDPTNHRHDADTGSRRALWAAYAFFVGPLSGSLLERSVLFGSVFAACVLFGGVSIPGVRLPLVTVA